ncbi:hypothetical protein OH77DRAFT_1319952 [Trametes cingulata]|nr:hypothetical protein OH77DRAFT_1319952 [Trametes cingulata]
MAVQRVRSVYPIQDTVHDIGVRIQQAPSNACTCEGVPNSLAGNPPFNRYGGWRQNACSARSDDAETTPAQACSLVVASDPLAQWARGAREHPYLREERSGNRPRERLPALVSVKA